MDIKKSPFGNTPLGPASLFTCTNSNGIVVKLTDYGAIVVSVETPDLNGKRANIALGFPTIDGYLLRHPYFGATVGRFCNRIAKGQFELDGQEYKLATNNGANHLHGGVVGFDRVIWQAEAVRTNGGVGVRFTRRSPDGEEGYPGNLDVSALYLLTNEDELRVEFTATADRATPVNLTNHSYWNLHGAGSGKILDHQLMIAADQYLPVDSELIPTGELKPVAGTPLDFRQPTAIGARIANVGGNPIGYDHCYVLRSKGQSMELAARVADPASGRVLEVYTDQPGVQLYTGNFLSGGESDGGFGQHAGLCLETQHFPDSPNQPNFPSTILHPGETFRRTTVHRFSVKSN
jgi:aldose 1-epimerase